MLKVIYADLIQKEKKRTRVCVFMCVIADERVREEKDE